MIREHTRNVLASILVVAVGLGAGIITATIAPEPFYISLSSILAFHIMDVVMEQTVDEDYKHNDPGEILKVVKKAVRRAI